VHKYPACLVYIAWSYYDAARILRNYWHDDEAIALLAVEIPNIDIIGVNHSRHVLSGNLHVNAGGWHNMIDYTNGVRHLQAAISYNSNDVYIVKDILKRVPYNSNIWASTANTPLTTHDMLNEIRRGYYKSTNLWCGKLIQEALEHDWPLPADIPAVLMENRILSNNIFEHKKRKLD